MLYSSLKALQRFAAGKTINRTMQRALTSEGYISIDEYGSLQLTKQGECSLKREKEA